ncbi:hypothetical protein TYRP_022894 [Tyrophagus putrescentiae]|nr:hypothetical protein TYRP_022894 [Tyrophagus putrescentiae]
MSMCICSGRDYHLERFRAPEGELPGGCFNFLLFLSPG